ncbi:MAG TPA: ABC transporter permease [Actinopolymorphaceae bacterium]|jgi:simple sugar transport system permease protein
MTSLDSQQAGSVEAAPRRVGLVARRVADVFLRWREASIVAVAVLLMLYFQATTGIFFTEGNLITVSQYVAATAIIAVGQVLLLVSGEIDLSVGNVYTLAPFLMHFAIDLYGVPVLPAIAIALVLCACIGLANGLITVVLRVPSFVTTLGMLFVVSGITLTTSGAYPVPIPEPATGVQPWLGAAGWSEITWALLIVAFFHVVLTQTRWGVHTIAVGGNLLGAREAGIRVGRIKIGNFMICSTLGGFAGIIEAFRIDSIDPSAGGTTIMFAAVAAAVIGGTALAGGSGTIIGALLGAIVLGVLRDGFNLIGVSAYTFDLIIGVAILIAMVSNVRLATLRRAGRT